MHGKIPMTVPDERATRAQDMGKASAKIKGARSRPGGQKIAILVAGMHRSGTSALTRILSMAGDPDGCVQGERYRILGNPWPS